MQRRGPAWWGEISTLRTIGGTHPHRQDFVMNSITTFRDLAHRRNDGIDVTMFWDSATDRVTVAVNDAKGGDAFEISVLPGERAMDVFHHPFAYAAAADRKRPPVLLEAS